jgi:hypothetical protein
MRRNAFVALGASVLALAIPATASATGSEEPSGDSSGGNCNSSGALVAANCTNISGPQVQVGGGLQNEQNQNNSQQNGNNSDTSNTNTNVAGAGAQPTDGYEGESSSSGGGGNCNQRFAAVAANCTNISGEQEQSSNGSDMVIGFVDGPGSSASSQNQNNNQQNGTNSETSNVNSNVAGGHPSNDWSDGDESGTWTKDEAQSGGGGNCNQKFAALALNCTNYSGGQEQSGGGEIPCYEQICTASVPGGSSGSSQNQNNNQQNGNNSGTHNYNSNGVAGGGGPNGGSSSGGGGGNCNQAFVFLAANCSNYSGGQEQSAGGGIRVDDLLSIGGGGQGASQNQNNNQQNGNNSGTHNYNSNVVGGHPPNDGQDGNSGSWSKDGRETTKDGGPRTQGSGGNCNQAFAAVALNCTNYSDGQEQSSGGSLYEPIQPGDGGSQGGGQNQNNNQQNGNNSGTSNVNRNVALREERRTVEKCREAVPG